MTDGIRELGYLGLEVRDLAAWRDFALRVLGAQVIGEDGLRIRLDDQPYRLWIDEGPADDLAFLGWRGTIEGLDAIEDAQLATVRGVDQLFRFTDPAGIPSELYTGLHPADSPFESRRIREGFVTGDQGLGHVAVTSPSREEGERFYGEVLGMHLRDRIVATLGAYEVDLAFFGVNSRHHSIAVGGPLPKRLHHLMIQVASLDDLGRAYDRASRAGCLATTLGRHPNDQMVSFYVTTPSGFQLELGWGGVAVDVETWEPTTHNCIALWGHRPSSPARRTP